MEAKPLDMQVNSILYSLKVWLTSVVVAPLIYLTINSFISRGHYLHLETNMSIQVTMYVACVMFGALFSFFTWVLFVLIIKGIITLFSIFPQIKLVISFIGVLLTLGTFSIFSFDKELFKQLSWLMISNCLCIAAGSLYYTLAIPAGQNDIAVE